MKNVDKWIPTKFVYENDCLIANVNYVGSGSKYIADLVAALYSRYLPVYAAGDFLDLGCGTVPLYAVYRDHVKTVTCADWSNCIHDTSYVDFDVDLNNKINIPLDSYDTVLLSDVLEHVYDPKSLLLQLYDVLRDGGRLIMNTPFAYWEHEAPHDYYRYTRYFFEKVARDIGFKPLIIEQVGGDSFDVLIDIFSKLNRIYPKKVKYKFLLGLVKRIKARSHDAPLNLPLGYFVILEK